MRRGGHLSPGSGSLIPSKIQTLNRCACRFNEGGKESCACSGSCSPAWAPRAVPVGHCGARVGTLRQGGISRPHRGSWRCVELRGLEPVWAAQRLRGVQGPTHVWAGVQPYCLFLSAYGCRYGQVGCAPWHSSPAPATCPLEGNGVYFGDEACAQIAAPPPTCLVRLGKLNNLPEP